MSSTPPSAWTVVSVIVTGMVSLIGVIVNYFIFRGQLAEKEKSTEKTLQNEHAQFSGQMDVKYRELEASLREELTAHANALREELSEVKTERDGWKTNYLTLLTETSELRMQYAAAVQQRDEYRRETESLQGRIRSLELVIERMKERFSIGEDES
jgi:chromosome segregation ATPase